MLLLFWTEDEEDDETSERLGTEYFDEYTGGRNPEYASSYQDSRVRYTSTPENARTIEYQQRDE